MRLLYGEEAYFINTELKKIKRDYDEVIVLDSNSKTDEIVMELSIFSLFADKKLVVLKDVPAFTNKDNEEILKLIQTNEERIMIVFIVTKGKLPTNNLFKFIKANWKVDKYDRLSNQSIVPTIREIVSSKGGEISNSAAIKLAGKLPNDLRVIIGEVQKLLLESNVITDKMIEESIDAYKTADSFELVNAIVENDSIGLIEAYNQKKVNGDQPTLILSQIMSVFSLAKLVDSYKKQHKSNAEISDATGIHVYRINRSNELLANISSKDLNEKIEELVDIDRRMKSENVDQFLLLDSYIVRLMK